MDGTEYEIAVKTEHSATAFLKRRCWGNYQRFCIRCHSHRLYKLAGARYRCKLCGYTFHDFSGRWVNKCRIGSRKWLMIVKWFEEGLSAKQMAMQSRLSYPTLLKALEVLRLAIIANTTDAEAWLNLVYLRVNSHARHQQPGTTAFGIVERDQRVKIEILDDFSIGSLQGRKPRMLRRSAIFYTDEYPPYTFVLFHDPMKTHASMVSKADQGHRIAESSDFFQFAERAIIHHHGIAKEKLPLYLKEIEFRYNHKDQPVFNRLCRFLVSFVPDA